MRLTSVFQLLFLLLLLLMTQQLLPLLLHVQSVKLRKLACTSPQEVCNDIHDSKAAIHLNVSQRKFKLMDEVCEVDQEAQQITVTVCSFFFCFFFLRVCLWMLVLSPILKLI